MNLRIAIAGLVAVVAATAPAIASGDRGGHPHWAGTCKAHGRHRCASALATVAPHAVASAPRYVTDKLLLTFRRGVSAQQEATALADAGVTVDHRIAALGVVVVRMSPSKRDAALAKLRASPYVATVERDEVIEKLDTTPNDTEWPLQWGLRQIGLPRVWDSSRGAPGLIVAVLDTGVDATQPDLAGALLQGINVLDGSHDTHDVDGHGTSVAGIVAARTDNREGVAGVCWDCSILPVKVLGDDGTGTMDALAAGVVQATNAGARIVNMSLGGPADSATLDAAIAYASAHDVVLVAAAGNNGSTAPFYPAALPGVIGVAGTDESGRLYSWSNSGTWVHVTAPGCDPAPSLRGTFVIFCGTSAAAPVVSGLAALARSVQPDASASEVAQALSGHLDAVSMFTELSGALPVPTATLPSASRPSGTAAASAVRWVIRSALTPRLHRRVVRRTVAAGPLVATLHFRRGLRLRLSVAKRGARRRLARVTGRSPLVVRRKLGAGTYVFSVIGAVRARSRYTLVIQAKRAIP
jgi:hypothetical protein